MATLISARTATIEHPRATRSGRLSFAPSNENLRKKPKLEPERRQLTGCVFEDNTHREALPKDVQTYIECLGEVSLTERTYLVGDLFFDGNRFLQTRKAGTKLDPNPPPADDLSAYEGPFGWVKAIEGVKEFLVKAKAQYLDDLLIQSVVDNFTAKSEILDAWDWEGLVVTNIRSPIPKRFARPKSSEDYKRFIRTLYSPHAHPVYLAFKYPACGVNDILQQRDEYLNYKLKHLSRTKIAEPVYQGDGERPLLYEWSMQPLVMWGKFEE